jgi:hypothetical protein
MNLTAALLAVLLTEKVASAAVSPVLVSATVRTAVTGTASQGVLDLVGEKTGYSLASVVKILGLSLLVMTSIVSIGSSQGWFGKWTSAMSGWLGSRHGASAISCPSSGRLNEPVSDPATSYSPVGGLAIESMPVNDAVPAGSAGKSN